MCRVVTTQDEQREGWENERCEGAVDTHLFHGVIFSSLWSIMWSVPIVAMLQQQQSTTMLVAGIFSSPGDTQDVRNLVNHSPLARR